MVRTSPSDFEWSEPFSYPVVNPQHPFQRTKPIAYSRRKFSPLDRIKITKILISNCTGSEEA